MGQYSTCKHLGVVRVRGFFHPPKHRLSKEINTLSGVLEFTQVPTTAVCRPNAGPTSGQRRGRWPDIGPALDPDVGAEFLNPTGSRPLPSIRAD